MNEPAIPIRIVMPMPHGIGARQRQAGEGADDEAGERQDEEVGQQAHGPRLPLRPAPQTQQRPGAGRPAAVVSNGPWKAAR